MSVCNLAHLSGCTTASKALPEVCCSAVAVLGMQRVPSPALHLSHDHAQACPTGCVYISAQFAVSHSQLVMQVSVHCLAISAETTATGLHALSHIPSSLAEGLPSAECTKTVKQCAVRRLVSFSITHCIMRNVKEMQSLFCKPCSMPGLGQTSGFPVTFKRVHVTCIIETYRSICSCPCAHPNNSQKASLQSKRRNGCLEVELANCTLVSDEPQPDIAHHFSPNHWQEGGSAVQVPEEVATEASQEPDERRKKTKRGGRKWNRRQPQVDNSQAASAPSDVV